jgi:hypothetical protein
MNCKLVNHQGLYTQIFNDIYFEYIYIYIYIHIIGDTSSKNSRNLLTTDQVFFDHQLLCVACRITSVTGPLVVGSHSPSSIYPNIEHPQPWSQKYVYMGLLNLQ